jgi:hypothetical protein
MPNIQLQFRRGTSTEWSNANTFLADGELAIETDTRSFKIGNGMTGWNSLSYGGLLGPTGPTGVVGPLASGSASAPSLTFQSDTSSGMFLPEVSSLAFTTAGVERMRVSSNVTISGQLSARIVTSNISGTSLSINFGNTNGNYYYITNTGFNAMTLTYPGSNVSPGAYNVFRNTTASNLSVTLTYSGGGSGVTSPLVISSSNSSTIVWNGTTYILF